MTGDETKATLQGDITGGLIAGILSLPEAMAFGAIVFLSLGQEYLSFGVVSGLIALAFSNIVGAFMHGVRVMSTGPYALSSLMLASAMTILMGKDVVTNSPDAAATAIVLLLFIVFLAGLLQSLFGVLKVGELAKYIPYPVVAGLMNGIAIVIFIGQIRPMLGLDKDASLLDVGRMLADLQPFTLVAGLVTIGIIFVGPRLTKKVPGPVLGIIVGSAAYYAFSFIGFADALGPLIGNIPFSIPLPQYLPEFGALFFESGFLGILVELLPLAAGIAVIISLRTLLGAVAIDNVTQERSNTSKELIGQGLANMLTSIFGGVVVAGYSGQPIANYQNGGRTPRARLVVGLFGLSVLLFLGPAVGLMPEVVLAGILVTLAFSMVDRWSLKLVGRLFSQGNLNLKVVFDLALNLLVIGVLLGLGIFEAVGVGILASVVFFVYRMSMNTIRRQYNASRVRSNVERQIGEINLLEEHGHTIEVLELEGSLFFGTTDKLADAIETILSHAVRYIIIDFKRVSDIDSTGAKILAQLKDRVQRNKATLLVSSVSPRNVMGEVFEELGILEKLGRDRCFASIEGALAQAEDGLLNDLIGADRYDHVLSLNAMNALAAMSSSEQATFAEYCTLEEYEDGVTVFEQGAPGNEMYLIDRGRIRLYISVGLEARREELLAMLCPGTICGEMAILDRKPRSAKAVADGALTCYRLSLEALERMRREHPEIAYKLMVGLAHELTKRIRIANRLNTELKV